MQKPVSPPKVGKSRRVALNIPQLSKVGLWPLIIAVALSGIEIAIAFLDIIVQAATPKNGDSALSTLLSGGLLSPLVINWHMTWCIPFSFTLSFIENTNRWSLNRKKYNLFGGLNATVATIFLVAVLYNWLWANNGELMLQFCKYFLIPFGLSMSQEALREYIYSDTVKYIVDLIVCWGFPAQCVIVLVDACISMCGRGRERVIYIIVRTDNSGRISAKLDPRAV